MVKSKSKPKRAQALEDFVFKTMNPKANIRPELKEKIQEWIISFYHLDPRYKILTFFNLVAEEGADKLIDEQVDERNSYAIVGSNGNISNSDSTSMVVTDDNIGSDRDSSAGADSNSYSSGMRSPHRDTYRVNAHLHSRPSARHIRPSTLSLLSSLFNATSILTVWRPCSNDAMRKMMEGTGVGKGLDIKGKSAKKGTLSAYVPFMQIFNNDHKSQMQPISECAEMRIYYKSKELREHAFEVLEKFIKDGPPEGKNANESQEDCAITLPETSLPQKLENTYEVNGAEEVEAKTSEENGHTSDGGNTEDKVLDEEDHYRLPPHKDPESPLYVGPSPKLKRIKKFVKNGFYGIECSQRLFWYATVQDADISRAGTGTETGRPSLPAFQDANMRTLKEAQSQLPKPSPMPVVLQHKSFDDIKKDFEAKQKQAKKERDGDDDDFLLDGCLDDDHPLDGCLDPLHLVLAYEEQGTIKPVVSDFDSFLLGWRREALWFGCNLPRDQENLMMWEVDRIEEILEDQKRNPTNSDTWTVRWLEVKKKAAAEGFHVDTPEYGFGDPKSTSIMEHAAIKLQSTGAVRHGSECFNYNFPQEIDEMFLLISDTLKPVPWKYVNVKDLQAILSKKIAEGFVFPLNPKWILCDPGWKKIYDDLMASDALYANLSKDVWFPPYCGVRNRIEDIFKRHPNGFQPATDTNKAKVEKSKAHHSGRRQSASNILRETLNEAGSELTGNAFADLAEIELSDFIGRTSGNPSNKKSGMGDAINMAIDELHEDTRRHIPFKQHDKKPSLVSRTTSPESGSSGKYSPPNSNRFTGLEGKTVSNLPSSTKPLRKLVKGAVSSTRKMFVPQKPVKKSHRSRTTGFISEIDKEIAGVPNLSGFSDSMYAPRSSSRKTRQVPETLLEHEDDHDADANEKSKQKVNSSKETNKEPRKQSKWSKIKSNLKHAKSGH